METVSKKENPISGISCDVVNCEYHGEEHYCHASEIKVCSLDPVQQCSVQCATFVPKTGR